MDTGAKVSSAQTGPSNLLTEKFMKAVIDGRGMAEPGGAGGSFSFPPPSIFRKNKEIKP